MWKGSKGAVDTGGFATDSPWIYVDGNDFDNRNIMQELFSWVGRDAYPTGGMCTVYDLHGFDKTYQPKVVYHIVKLRFGKDKNSRRCLRGVFPRISPTSTSNWRRLLRYFWRFLLMAFIFPEDKADFEAPNGITYAWRDKWVVKSFHGTVHVGDNPPDEEDVSIGDLWYCTKADDLTLYVYVNETDEWVSASPPVSLDGIESNVAGLNAAVDELRFITAKQGTETDASAQFHIAQLAHDTHKKVEEIENTEEVLGEQVEENRLAIADHELRIRQNIITVQEEIEQLAPSFERGVWNFSSRKPDSGQYALLRFFTYDQPELRRQTCSNALTGATRLIATHLSLCNRAYDGCVAQYDAYKPGTAQTCLMVVVSFYTSDWNNAVRVEFHTFDEKGAEHTFANVEEDNYLDLFNLQDDGFKVSMIDACLGKKDDIYTFEIRPVQSLGVPGDQLASSFSRLTTRLM